MVITNQHLPCILRPANAAPDRLSASLDACLRASPAKYIGSGVDWIGQQPMNRIVARQPPFHYSPLSAVDGHWHLDAFVDRPKATWRRCRSPRTYGTPSIAPLDPFVGIKFQTIIGATDIADCNARVEVAAGGLESQGFLRTLTENRQLHLAECSLHAEQKPIIYLFGIVNAVFVYD